MKNKSLLIRIALVVVMLPFIIGACSDDDGSSTPSVDFGYLSSSSQEREASTITIPLRGDVDPGDLQIVRTGTAVEGEDYEFVGVTAEGVQVKILEDDSLESMETIDLVLTSSNLNLSGNNTHTITIVSDCEDELGLPASWFAGGWSATEDYGVGGTWGPYHVTVTVVEGEPNLLHFAPFYDRTQCGADIIFDVAAGTVHFPDQDPCSDNNKLISNSEGTFEILDLCGGEAEMTINLNYDGGDWVYRFVKDH